MTDRVLISQPIATVFSYTSDIRTFLEWGVATLTVFAATWSPSGNNPTDRLALQAGRGPGAGAAADLLLADATEPALSEVWSS
ncbi:MAG: hypothetical protein M3314_12480 [Actinomycetota bacterium]|nr:hypothetical protein [Actinomycetota bacterium]